MRQRRAEGLGPGQRGEVESGGAPGLTCVFSGSSDCCMENRAGDREESHPSAKKALKSHLLACHSSPKSTTTGATIVATMFQSSLAMTLSDTPGCRGRRDPREEHFDEERL